MNSDAELEEYLSLVTPAKHAVDARRKSQSSYCNRRQLFGCAFIFVVCSGLMLLLLPSEARRRAMNLHWLPYILPYTPVWLWDYLHGLAATRGGMWRYTSDVQPQLVTYILQAHSGYASLLDVACNMGFMLARLQRARPMARHFGSDISRTMISRARLRCPACAGLVQFDLARLANNESAAAAAGVHPLAPGLPKVVDLLVVSDVLYFMPFGNVPPIFTPLLPASAVRAAQRRLMDALVRLARKEVTRRHTAHTRSASRTLATTASCVHSRALTLPRAASPVRGGATGDLLRS